MILSMILMFFYYSNFLENRKKNDFKINLYMLIIIKNCCGLEEEDRRIIIWN